jgi:TonB family protein
MNAKSTRLAAIAAFGLFSFVGVFADVYTKTDGTSFDGEIYKLLDGSVYFRIGEERLNAPVEEFDSASQAAIQAWVAENPMKVDVHIKWDVQPAIKSSSMPRLPEQFLDEEFKGMVSVNLILSETGRVIHASINKSTHPDLEEPALEAAKAWIFVPAKVGGKAVRSKLRVPFKFVNAPPAPPSEEGSAS